MSLKGYKPKHGKAPWLTAFPPQVPVAAPKRIRSRTKERAKEERRYRKKAGQFIYQRAGQRCALFPDFHVLEVHHIFGRAGALLLWEPGWFAISRKGHCWVHDHPTEARALGLLCQPGDWNRRPEELEEKAKQLKELLAFNLAKR